MSSNYGNVTAPPPLPGLRRQRGLTRTLFKLTEYKGNFYGYHGRDMVSATHPLGDYRVVTSVNVKEDVLKAHDTYMAYFMRGIPLSSNWWNSS